MAERSRVGIYVRISDDREGRELGVERQEEDCRGLLDHLYEATLIEVYRDNDIGASTRSRKRRPDYERLLADAKAGRIDHVVAYTSSRLTRRPREHEDLIELAEQHGVTYSYVRSPSFDLNTSAGRRVARILAANDAGEAEDIAERVSRQKQQRQAEGRRTGGRRPFGFEPDGETLRKVEADAIADAAARILAGESGRSVWSEWNTKGLTTATGKPWDGSKFRQMMLRPSNAGLIGSGDRIVGKAVWDAIVPEETWRAIVGMLTDSARRTNKGVSRKLLGSFLYRCGKCGSLMQAGGLSAAGKSRYRCKQDGCQWRVAAPIDETVRQYVAAYLRQQGSGLIKPKDEAGPVVAELNALEKRAEQVAAAFGDPDSGMTAEQFKAANRPIQDRLNEVKAQLGQLQAVNALSGIADAEDAGQAFLDANADRQRLIIDMLVTVTILESRHGRRSGGGYFDPETVSFAWKE